MCWHNTRENTFIHCTQTKETAQQMVEEGLDWTKTGRTKCGPGTYFSGSAGAGEEHGAGNVPVVAKYTGNKKIYPVFEPCYYEAITNNQGLIKMLTKMGSDSTSLINKYCHDILQNDMGIDFLYASTGRAGGLLCGFKR